MDKYNRIIIHKTDKFRKEAHGLTKTFQSVRTQLFMLKTQTWKA